LLASLAKRYRTEFKHAVADIVSTKEVAEHYFGSVMARQLVGVHTGQFLPSRLPGWMELVAQPPHD
jgi:hypothetical protein